MIGLAVAGSGESDGHLSRWQEAVGHGIIPDIHQSGCAAGAPGMAGTSHHARRVNFGRESGVNFRNCVPKLDLGQVSNANGRSNVKAAFCAVVGFGMSMQFRCTAFLVQAVLPLPVTRICFGNHGSSARAGRGLPFPG